MTYLRVWTVLLLWFLCGSYAQSGHIRVLDQTIIQQQGSPVAFVKWRGSSALMKNTSEKTIASFVFVCVVRNGKAFSTVDTYDSEEGSTAPGGFSNEGWIDATPLNACRSWKGLLAVGTVKFSDGTSWQTSLVPSLAVDRGKTQELKSRDFYWDEKHDVRQWLKENEAYLKRGDGCTLTSSWMNEKQPASPSDSVHEIASFVTNPGDEETTKVIHDSDSRSGLDVRVGVRYVPGGPGGSYWLQIALGFEGSPDGVFDEVGGAQAETLRFENWKWLAAVKSVRIGDLRYRFSLRCENGRTFLNFLRRPVKSKPTAKSQK